VARGRSLGLENGQAHGPRSQSEGRGVAAPAGAGSRGPRRRRRRRERRRRERHRASCCCCSRFRFLAQLRGPYLPRPQAHRGHAHRFRVAADWRRRGEQQVGLEGRRGAVRQRVIGVFRKVFFFEFFFVS
jgi:hypothetical protein